MEPLKPKCANCPNREQCVVDQRIGRELSKQYATFPIRKIVKRQPG